MKYSWPGNIRELSHTLEKMVVLTEEYVILPENLPSNMYDMSQVQADFESSDMSISEALEQVEKKMVESAYRKTGTSTVTAKLLGISQPRAYRLLQKYEIR